MYYIITLCSLFVALFCGFMAAKWLNRKMDREL